MWYRDDEPLIRVAKTVGLEEKILRIDAESAVRRRMYLLGDQHPEAVIVNKKVDQVIKRLQADYHNLNNVRNDAEGDDLASLVQVAVDKVMPLPKDPPKKSPKKDKPKSKDAT